ncbi:phosphoribosylaminoimidazolesuccinocarboxamide synthase [Sphingobacteriaceae bacterium]|nr:phosphoribosylaminoimidazolesuccinocarboxamide synthase [Sphingobacteriaceae bacterium]
METEKKFITKTGFCHVFPDRIVLTRDGIMGSVAKVIVGNNIQKILLIYGGIACFLFYSSYDLYVNGQTGKAIFFGLISVYLIYGIINSLNNSATPIIDRNKIKDVKLKKAIPGLTRSRFEIKFEDEDGKIKRRLIILSGLRIGGTSETEKAIKIMREENLLKTPDF